MHDDALIAPTDSSAKSGNGPASAQRPAKVTGVRIGRHETFDRVVIDFTKGSPLPAYEVDWVPAGEQLLAPGSGQVVEVEGNRVLEVTLSGTQNRNPESVDADLMTVQEVLSFGSFEAVASLGIGVATSENGGEVGFRVSTVVEGPPRLIIDVAHGQD